MADGRLRRRLDAAAGAAADGPARRARPAGWTEHDRAARRVAGVLAEPQLAELGTRPDLAALDGARCRAATADARSPRWPRSSSPRRCAQGLDELAGELTAAEVELDEQRAWAEQVTALADLATGRGSNTLQMRLQSFVLAARLEQVAEVASRRLLDMSGGRYTFLHSDAQGRHGARGGLGPGRVRRVHRRPAAHQDAVRRGELHGLARPRARPGRRGHGRERRRAARHASSSTRASAPSTRRPWTP